MKHLDAWPIHGGDCIATALRQECDMNGQSDLGLADILRAEIGTMACGVVVDTALRTAAAQEWRRRIPLESLQWEDGHLLGKKAWAAHAERIAQRILAASADVPLVR